MIDNNDLINFDLLRSIIKENDLLVDVGSNYGYYTELFNEILNGSGKIYSIELCPNNYKILHNKFNNHNNIVLINKAVTDSNDMIPYFKGSDANTNNIIGHDMNYNPNEKVGLIGGIRLDSLLNEYDTINLIKIDVEGAEYSVLLGMSGIINRVNYILVECHLDNDWDKIKNLLINEYKLICKNVINNNVITNESPRAYQCFCKNNYNGNN